MPTPSPANAFVERLNRERETALATIDQTLERATQEDRDLNETENTVLVQARARLEEVDKQRGEWADVFDNRARGDELASRISGALSRSSSLVRVESPGLQIPDDPDDQVRRLFRSSADYLDTYIRSCRGDTAAGERLQRALANQLLADNPGVVPTPILGPVVNLINRSRPTVVSAANRPMPGSGASFTRPKVTQHTQAGEQTTEKTELASRKMTIAPLTVNKHTYGGTLDISFQNRDWTDPAILQIVIDDLGTQYGIQTNAALAGAFAAAVTGTVPITAPADGPKLLKAVATASAQIQAATGLFPDTMWVSPDMWASIASLTDTTGRALFATIGPMNAQGQMTPSNYNGNVYGLGLVVDGALPALTIIVGVSSLLEFYEQIGGQLSVTEPTILGIVVAYYGYVAWCIPEANAFRKTTGVTAMEGFESEVPAGK